MSVVWHESVDYQMSMSMSMSSEAVQVEVETADKATHVTAT